MRCNCKTLNILKIMAMEETIRRKLTEALNPSLLEVVNESHLHKGHAGDDGSGESHFRVMVVAEAFAGLSRVDAHRLVCKVLEKELKNGIHALSIKALA